VDAALPNHLFSLLEDIDGDVADIDFIEKSAGEVLAIGLDQTRSEQPETKPGRVANHIDQSNGRE
jgi:hypothetical protein